MMHEYFDLARMDLAQALKLDSYLDIAYARLMTIEKFGGLHERYVAIGDKALAVLADPYEIHWSQLSFIRPKWNRPIRELHDRLATLQRDYGDDPRYSYLKGYIEYVEADFQYWEGKYDQALTTIEKAIADAPLSDRYIRKAYILLKLHRHEDALESIDKALDISSDDADYNFLKGSTLRRYFYWGGEYRSRVEEAEEFYDRAVASDSFNPDYLLKRADYYLMRARGYARPKHVAQRLGYQRRAIEDLFDAARVGDQFPEVNIETAKFFMHHMKEPVTAITFFELALYIDPLTDQNRQRYELALSESRKCDSLEALASRMHKCRLGSSCTMSISFASLVQDLIKQCDRTMASRREQKSKPRRFSESAKRRILAILGSCRGAFESMESEAAESSCRELADAGDPTAQYALGIVHTNGFGVRLDYGEATSWYEKAASQGHADAQAELGIHYRRGMGLPLDIAKGVKLMEQAAEKGSTSALLYLADVYLDGGGHRKDPAKAKALLEDAVRKGSDSAARMLKHYFPEPG